MGEIADALRRARGGGPGLPGPAPDPSLERAARPADPRPAVASGMPAVRLETIQPVDAAIVLEDGPALEACRQIALSVRAALEARRAHSAAVVSGMRDEGKTTTSCNLALALGSLSQSREIALLDLDLRRPSIANVLGLTLPFGVERVLRGEASIDEVRVEIEHPAIDVYPAIEPQRAAHEVLTRQRLGELVAELERRYAIVIVDTPPALLVPDARLILERVASWIPVARAGVTRVRSFRQLLDALPRSQLLSTLLNGARVHGRYYEGYPYTGAKAEAEESRRSQRRRRGRSK